MTGKRYPNLELSDLTNYSRQDHSLGNKNNNKKLLLLRSVFYSVISNLFVDINIRFDKFFVVINIIYLYFQLFPVTYKQCFIVINIIYLYFQRFPVKYKECFVNINGKNRQNNYIPNLNNFICFVYHKGGMKKVITRTSLMFFQVIIFFNLFIKRKTNDILLIRQITVVTT